MLIYAYAFAFAFAMGFSLGRAGQIPSESGEFAWASPRLDLLCPLSGYHTVTTARVVNVHV